MRFIISYDLMSLFHDSLINSGKSKFLKTILYESLSIPMEEQDLWEVMHILYLAIPLKTRKIFIEIANA